MQITNRTHKSLKQLLIRAEPKMAETHEDGLWRVWIRSAPNDYFKEAFRDCAKRSEMIKTVRLAKMSAKDIKVMNISTWTMLSPEEISSIMQTSQ